jgi:hypothetical protein
VSSVNCIEFCSSLKGSFIMFLSPNVISLTSLYDITAHSISTFEDWSWIISKFSKVLGRTSFYALLTLSLIVISSRRWLSGLWECDWRFPEETWRSLQWNDGTYNMTNLSSCTKRIVDMHNRDGIRLLRFRFLWNSLLSDSNLHSTIIQFTR